jgi:RNA polymerase sigma factor (sigma-70 family)
VPVLAAPQERRLAEINQRGLPVRAARAELSAELRREPTARELADALGLASAEAAAAALARAQGAHDLLVEFNLRLAFSVARRYANNGCLDMSDLIPEGVVGLHKAVDRFDPGRGFKFSTYAHWWLRQAISRAIHSQGRDVRVPSSSMEWAGKLRKVAAAIGAQPGRTAPPTYRELAAAMNMPLERLVTMMRATRSPRGFEDAMDRSGAGVKDMGKGDAEDAMDAMWDEDEPPVDALAEKERDEFLRETINLMLSTLPKRERNVVRLRYGLLGSHAEESAALSAVAVTAADDDSVFDEAGLGLQAVGATYGLSRERIRQIETSALRHLRMPWRMGVIRRAKTCESLTPDAVGKLNTALSAAERWG